MYNWTLTSGECGERELGGGPMRILYDSSRIGDESGDSSVSAMPSSEVLALMWPLVMLNGLPPTVSSLNAPS